MKPGGVMLLAALTAMLVAGCESTGPHNFGALPETAPAAPEFTVAPATNRLNPEWLQPATNLFTLGPGDRLEIELMGDDTTRTSAFVGPDGKIYFYLLPGLDVWGLTLAQT